MKVRLMVDIEVGGEPITDAVADQIQRHGDTAGDHDLSVGEWVGAVAYDVLNAGTPSEWFVQRVEDFDIPTREDKETAGGK